MASIGGGSSDATISKSKNYVNFKTALFFLSSLFFMWGFITSLNDILIPHLKALFVMNYTQTMLIQFTFFGAYFLVSLPAGSIVGRIGYKKGIVLGLIITALGAFLFYPASIIVQYWFFLLAFFVLASGITILQVSANPYVAILGSPETASARLNLTQALNSLGTTAAPIFGATFILAAANHAENSAKVVQGPYIGIALTLLVIAGIFFVLKLPVISAKKNKGTIGSAWQYRHLILGAIAIFVYVGAEVSIGSFMINFLGLDSIANLSHQDAALYVSLYWGGAMIGRFFGSIFLSDKSRNFKFFATGIIIIFAYSLAYYLIGDSLEAAIYLIFVALSIIAFIIGQNKPSRTLATLAASAILLVTFTTFTHGHIALWSIVAVGLFNSIMFPTIFTLAIDGLGEHTGQGSGILVMFIVGGAIIPLITGALADTIGIHLSFLITIICYAYILFYGVKGYKHNS